MLNGARQGRQFSKGRPAMETARCRPDAQPCKMADAGPRKWQDSWTTHRLEMMAPLAEAEAWPELPASATQPLREAVASYPVPASTGRAKLPPRALRCLSDEALQVLAALLMKAGALRGWPDHGFARLLARAPNPGGRARVIGLQNAIIRM